MFKKVWFAGLLISAATILPVTTQADNSLLNVSYDVTREFYKDFNPSFIKYWKQKTGETIPINQSHGGSSKQASTCSDGWS